MPRNAIEGSNGLHAVKRPIRKKKKKITKKSVKKMIAMMNPVKPDQPSPVEASPSNSNNHNVEDFLSTGRTGRRNALPDILNDHSLVTSSELPTQLEALTTNDNVSDPNKPSTSKQPDNVR